MNFSIADLPRVWICARLMAIGSPPITWDLNIPANCGCTLVHLCLTLRGIQAWCYVCLYVMYVRKLLSEIYIYIFFFIKLWVSNTNSIVQTRDIARGWANIYHLEALSRLYSRECCNIRHLKKIHQHYKVIWLSEFLKPCSISDTLILLRRSS